MPPRRNQPAKAASGGTCISCTAEAYLVAILIVVAPFALWARHHDLPWVNTYHVVAYTLICGRFNSDGTCATRRVAGPKQFFQITPSQKRVEGTIADRPMRLQNCVVRDARNWRCDARSSDGEVFPVFRVNGYFDTLESPPVTAYAASYWEWRLRGGRD